MPGRLRALFDYYAGTTEWPEPRRDGFGRLIIPDDFTSRLVLTLGQVIAAVSCAGTVVGGVLTAALLFGRLKAALPGAEPVTLWFGLVIVTAVHFVFWLAMFFVFTHAKWVVRLVECQQAVLAKLLDRWDDRPAASEPRPAGAEVVLRVVETRMIVGGWALLECDDGGWPVPPLDEGVQAEVRWPGGKVLRATVAGEERHVRARRPGRVAFTLGGTVTAESVDGATEVRLLLP